jgi:hypothetical protein
MLAQGEGFDNVPPRCTLEVQIQTGNVRNPASQIKHEYD